MDRSVLNKIDVICPVFNLPWKYIKDNVDSWYRELPINRLLIGCANPDSEIYTKTKSFFEKYDNVVFYDQQNTHTTGFCIAELIKRVETDWFVYIHSDVELTPFCYKVMEESIKEDVGIIESERVQFSYENPKSYPTEYVCYHYIPRAFSGFQLFQRKAIEKIIKVIEDDYLSNTEDICFQNVCINAKYKYIKSFAMHVHTTTKLNLVRTPQQKIIPEKDAFILTNKMNIKALIKYCTITEITKKALFDALQWCIHNNELNLDEVVLFCYQQKKKNWIEPIKEMNLGKVKETQKGRCVKCVMNEGRVKIGRDGVCQGCKNFDRRKKVDWEKRYKELEVLCDKYRKNDGSYDCIITVSGGKDSTFQVGLFKEKFHMHPLCVMVDNFSWTQTGMHNYDNLGERFGVDILRFTLNRKAGKILTRYGFLTELKPMLYWDKALYTVPQQVAVNYGIKLVVWGEDSVYIRGGRDMKETPNALKQLHSVAEEMKSLEPWCIEGLTLNDLQSCVLPPKEKLDQLEVIFTSYYIPWLTWEHIDYFKKNGGWTFKETGEWNRKGLEGLEEHQVDSIGYLMNNWFKFIKFGFSNQTEQCSIGIRESIMNREEAVRRVNLYDHLLDKRMLIDFLKFIEISENQFFETIDKFANREILEKGEDGLWKLKEPAK